LRANIFAGDKVTEAFFNLIPIGVPVIFLMLHVAVAGASGLHFHSAGHDLFAGCVAQEEH